MLVKIVTILEEVPDGYKVILEINNQNIIAEWNGDKLAIDRVYDVELEIDENFTWGDNIILSTENRSSIRQEDKHTTIVAKLDFNYEDNLASINMNESIILIELEGLQHNVSGKWVRLNCRKIKVYDTNL